MTSEMEFHAAVLDHNLRPFTWTKHTSPIRLASADNANVYFIYFFFVCFLTNLYLVRN